MQRVNRFSGEDEQKQQQETGQDVEKGSEQETNGQPPQDDEVTWRERISHFTWPWFASTMSTGAVAVVLANTPNRFPGLQTIGTIFFIVDLILFVTFTICMAVRFGQNPRKLASTIHHPVEGLFFGSYWVSISLILSGTQSYGVPSAGPWLVKALLVLFWIYCACVIMIAIGQYYVLFQKERLNVADAMPAWIFPIYPLLVIGPLASAMIPSQSEAAAYPMWVGAVMMQGLAWTVSLMMYTIYTQRLMSSALPSPPTRPGMFVSVGPAGYTAAGLIGLATQAPKVMPSIAFSIKSSFDDGQVVKILGITAGTFVALFSFWFCCISTVSVLSGVKEMSFTLNWWAFIFPNAGLCLAIIQLGGVFASPGINGVASALTLILVILWLMVAAANIRAVVRGNILWPGKDEDWVDVKVQD